MAAEPQSGVTTLLGELRAGDQEARSRLLQEVYDELRRMAGLALRGHLPDFSLQSGDVVNEAYLRLFGKDFRPENRSHFFGAAANAMREVVADHAKNRKAKKRHNGGQRLALDDVVDFLEGQNLEVERLRQALDELAAVCPRPSEVLTLRFFFCYTVKETAGLLGVSEKTVQNDQRFGLAWLHKNLKGAGP
jgi:RNA polymerase sigma factor (TIGR02999 family)